MPSQSNFAPRNLVRLASVSFPFPSPFARSSGERIRPDRNTEHEQTTPETQFVWPKSTPTSAPNIVFYRTFYGETGASPTPHFAHPPTKLSSFGAEPGISVFWLSNFFLFQRK